MDMGAPAGHRGFLLSLRGFGHAPEGICIIRVYEPNSASTCDFHGLGSEPPNADSLEHGRPRLAVSCADDTHTYLLTHISNIAKRHLYGYRNPAQIPP